MQHPFPVTHLEVKTDQTNKTLIGKLSKMSNFQDLPDELILEILSYSEINIRIRCGQVSRRIRKISYDDSLWVTASLKKKIVKIELLEMILAKGCKILNIYNCTILGSLDSNIRSQLRVLNLSLIFTAGYPIYPIYRFYEELLLCCCSLQCLLIEGAWLTPKIAKSICKNGKTLEILNLRYSSVDEISTRSPQRNGELTLGSSYLQEIFEYCQELKEVNFNEVEGLKNGDLEVLAKSIPPNVEKLNLTGSDLMDTHVKILLSRCNKIKILSLEATLITENSLTHIRRCLNLTLEELSLGENKIIGTGFLQLKLMPRLKILNLYDEIEDFTKIQYLRQQLPHLTIDTT